MPPAQNREHVQAGNRKKVLYYKCGIKENLGKVSEVKTVLKNEYLPQRESCNRALWIHRQSIYELTRQLHLPALMKQYSTL